MKVRSYNEYDRVKLINEYRDEMQKSRFHELIAKRDIEEATKSWMSTVVALSDKHAPEKEMRIKSVTEGIPWYDDNTHALKAAKTKALRNDRSKGNPKTKTILNSITNKLKYLKRKQKKAYFKAKIDEQSGNPKRLWGILKEVSRTETPVEETLPDTVNQSTADDFNNYFAKIGKSIQDQLGISCDFRGNNNPGFKFQEETPETIRKLIDRLKPKVANGYDRIPAKVIEDISDVACGDLAKLVNLSYNTCTST